MGVFVVDALSVHASFICPLAHPQVPGRNLGAAFERSVAEVAEVLAVHAVAGQLDYLLHVVARDTHDMERVQHRLTALPGVEHLHTHVVLKDVLNREVVDPA